MPLYEYYCSSCATTFEKRRPLRAAEETAVCPAGHAGATRTVSLFAMFTRGADGSTLMPRPGRGCACGDACARGGCGLSRT